MTNLKIGQRIKLPGTVTRESDGKLILPRVLFDGASRDVLLDDCDLSHAEIIEEPVKKKPSEIITERVRELRGQFGGRHDTYWVESILEYLDSMTEEK